MNQKSLNLFIVVILFMMGFGPVFADQSLSVLSQKTSTLVTSDTYLLDDPAALPSPFPGPVEFSGEMHYPESFDEESLPLILLLHGRHPTCYDPDTKEAFLQWPCTPPREMIPSFIGYQYLAEHLAGIGFFVVSISANGINAVDNSVSDLGMQARAELIQAHLTYLKRLSTTGDALLGNRFIGKLDFSRIGIMGHSRGGEGAVFHSILNETLGKPFGIRAILAVATVNYSRKVIGNVPMAVVVPTCDGDVFDLLGVHFYDDARYSPKGDGAPRYMLLTRGANHNYYNTIWTPQIFGPGAMDDWVGIIEGILGAPPDFECGVASPTRLTAAMQRQSFKHYAEIFFSAHVKGDDRFLPLLEGAKDLDSNHMPGEHFISFHPPTKGGRRLDVNRLLSNTHLTTNHLGGSVFERGLSSYGFCGAGNMVSPECLSPGIVVVINGVSYYVDGRQPHSATSILAKETPGLNQLRIAWNHPGTVYVNELPHEFSDLEDFTALQLRAGVNPDSPLNGVGIPQDFSIVLTDGDGSAASIRVSEWSRALFYPQGSTFPISPKAILNSIRIPLTAFGGVDLGDVRVVTLRFDQTFSGELLFSDLMFTRTGDF